MSLKLSQGLRALAACLALALAGAGALTTPPPAGAAASISWARQASSVSGGSKIVSISCVSRSQCVAVDEKGSVLAGNPSFGGSWRPETTTGSFKAVSCASGSLCVAVGAGSPDVAVGAPGAGFWSTLALGRALAGVACPAGGLCVAVDEAGHTWTSTNPAVRASWVDHGTIDAGVALQSISCASESLCVALNEGLTLLASSAPQAAGVWPAGFTSAEPVKGLSCAAGFCVAAGQSGGAIATADPVSPAPSWTSTSTGGTALSGISCVATGLCVAVGGAAGQAYASDDPAGLAPGWSMSATGVEDPGAVSCLPEGFCVAAGARGEVSTGLLPAPEARTEAATGVTESSATLNGAVDPQDAPLSSCGFEYGTAPSYGQSAPCASTPGPGSAPVAVSAAIAGLEPATVYHYRLRAASPTGQGLGFEGTFTTAAASTVPLVHPHPYITGVPANGDRLLCHPGASGSAVSFAYAWWRDASPIGGASGQIYHITPEDAGQHLQCQVTATNAAGSASARSAFVAVPAEGLPASAGETAIGTARIAKGMLELPVSCSPQADPACSLQLRMTAVARLRGKKVLALIARAPKKHPPRVRSQPVTLLSRKVSVPTGRQQTLRVALSPAGRRMLARAKAKRASAQLTVEGTVIGVLSATLAKERVSTVLDSAHAGRHRRAVKHARSARRAIKHVRSARRAGRRR